MGGVAAGIEERVWFVVKSWKVFVKYVIIVFVVAERRRRRNIVFFVFQVGQILSERRGVVDIGDKDAPVATVTEGGGGDHVRDWL
jgi:hypothetical protein